MKEQEYWQKGYFKKYYTELTDIIRLYIHRVFEINSLEMTSTEIYDVLKIQGLVKEELLEKLYSLFSAADLVKFAKEQPIGEENNRYYEIARDFITETESLSKQKYEAVNGDTAAQ